MSIPLGLLDKWVGTKLAVQVLMGQVCFVDFRYHMVIGTGDLGACSVVVVRSQHGAIVAHIPPSPSSAAAKKDPHAGDNNVRRIMDQVKDVFREHRKFFPSSSTHVICAVFNGEVALPEQVAIMQRRITKMGLEPAATHNYNVPVNLSVPGQGTVVVISCIDHGQLPSVYVEDRLVTEQISSEDTIRHFQPELSTQDYGASSSGYVVGTSSGYGDSKAVDPGLDASSYGYAAGASLGVGASSSGYIAGTSSGYDDSKAADRGLNASSYGYAAGASSGVGASSSGYVAGTSSGYDDSKAVDPGLTPGDYEDYQYANPAFDGNEANEAPTSGVSKGKHIDSDPPFVQLSREKNDVWRVKHKMKKDDICFKDRKGNVKTTLETDWKRHDNPKGFIYYTHNKTKYWIKSFPK